MSDLFTWHGAEEVEHRAVAHDAAAYFGDSIVKRARAMALVLPFLILLLLRGFRFIMKADTSQNIGLIGKWMGFFRGAHAGVLPTARSVIFATFTYFKPSFKPTDIGDTAQAVAYLASSPGARRAA